MIDLFLLKWKTTEHFCEECEAPLGRIPLAYYFSHVLPRGTYPEWADKIENIVLHCWDCHREWDFGDRQKMLWTLDIRERLLKEEKK